MHLDKTKLRLLIDKVERLSVSIPNNFYPNNKPSPNIAQQLKASLASLSSWLYKHPSLNNGATYGKKIAELKSKLPDTIRSGTWFPEKEAAELKTGLLALLRLINRENKSIFIVHGRDLQMREAVQSALRGLALPTVILEREDDNGQTVIEKFIKEAARCEYAVILYSADDEGRLRSKGRSKETPLRLRARQNVVLELGYFLGKLDRKNIFVLHSEESIEQPSDFVGVVYQSYDKAGKWKAKLVRELKTAGFKIPTKFSDRI
ncbi:hypothetical protein AHMF7605_29145 [Adhaeribacter arboris]|uniref:CD-NTase-associated protein 12/Pycsar effector protein TIR domain-containing protein n=1 Tax=Adhaeribacter arboris TaxID=2072846 RepID=A0A2T2Y904_9BACT|nr:nucleotide-binding protein [Adhaeribacter arboris]PSR51976.1 hypothetical protein AHMF7605_29145 [Adhaeribacter arboris]